MKTSKLTTTSSQKFVQILGVRIGSTLKSDLLNLIQGALTKKIQFYIVTPNPEIILEASSDPKLLEILNKATFSIPDGVGLKFVNNSLRIIKGRELMLDLLTLAEKKKLKVYLLGSKPNVNKKSVEKIKREFPHINVKGESGPILNKNGEPASEVNSSLQFEVVKDINNFKPDILFVGFGAPKQEKWIYNNMSSLNAKCLMTIGGSLDYYAGFVKPVPKLLENLGLEWLWRVIQEPTRIARIFKATVVFPLKVVLSGNQSKSQGENV